MLFLTELFKMRERIVKQETGHAAFNIKIHLDNMVSVMTVFFFILYTLLLYILYG